MRQQGVQPRAGDIIKPVKLPKIQSGGGKTGKTEICNAGADAIVINLKILQTTTMSGKY
jgi:hypothetical protein